MKTWMFALAAALAVVPLAGCLGGQGRLQGGESGAENDPPHAELTANKDKAWNGERVRFDGSGSTDPDGDVRVWRFDFGDETPPMEVRNEEDAEDVSHSYARGGEYQATLTVFDDGGEQGGALSDSDSVVVRVNDRRPVATQVIYAALADNESPTATFRQAFEVNGGADEIDINLTVRSSVPVAASEITARILDPDGEEMAESTVTVDAQDEESLDLRASPAETGTYILEIEAESGGATISGEVRVMYDEVGGAEDGGEGENVTAQR